MGVLALLIAAVAIWLIWSGKLQRMTAKDGMALGAALITVTSSSGFGWFVSWISSVVILGLCSSASLNSVL